MFTPCLFPTRQPSPTYITPVPHPLFHQLSHYPTQHSPQILLSSLCTFLTDPSPRTTLLPCLLSSVYHLLLYTYDYCPIILHWTLCPFHHSNQTLSFIHIDHTEQHQSSQPHPTPCLLVPKFRPWSGSQIYLHPLFLPSSLFSLYITPPVHTISHTPFLKSSPKSQPL